MKGLFLDKLLAILFYLLVGASLAYAGPVPLSDRVLDTVTAGTAEAGGSGGAIIGNSSEATITQTGGVSLEGEVQAGAKALNLVNSAESTVANGVNVWQGTGATSEGLDNPGFVVNQSNDIAQEQRRSASMPNYSRPEADTMAQSSTSGSETHDTVLDVQTTQMDLVRDYRNAINTSTAKVDTTIAAGITEVPTDIPEASFDTNVGKGLAIAGSLDANIDGGEVHVGLAVGGAVSAFADDNTNSASGFGGIDVGDADSDFTLYGRLILPELTLHIDGAGCGVAMGSCNAGGTSSEETDDLRDNSLIETELSTAIGGSDYMTEQTEVYRSPFELNDAQAEYIVVDDSSLNVSTTFTLALSGSAQNAAQGMNIVNSTGSAVANGVNVAQTQQVSGGNVLHLTQSNVISHSR
ncbi:MAG: hypothetical protein QNK24_11960 [Desulfuromusa sp.]|nr:hypothetical protein [Desulfuromusa sp.]